MNMKTETKEKADALERRLGPDYVAAMREALLCLGNAAVSVYPSHGRAPSPGSPAACEGAKSRQPRMPDIALNMATAFIVVGGEHALAFVRTITEPVLTTACWSCARSVPEPCALALWLLEPHIDTYTRGGRVYAVRYENMKEALKYGRSAGWPAVQLQKQENRIREVEQEALKLGYPRRTAKRKGKTIRTGIGQVMPSATELIRKMLDEEGTYRLLSSVAHGRTWAVQALGHRATGPDQKIGATRVTIFESHANVKALAKEGIVIAQGLTRALSTQHNYAGWDKKRLFSIFEQVYDKLKLKQSSRFWR